MLDGRGMNSASAKVCVHMYMWTYVYVSVALVWYFNTCFWAFFFFYHEALKSTPLQLQGTKISWNVLNVLLHLVIRIPPIGMLFFITQCVGFYVWHHLNWGYWLRYARFYLGFYVWHLNWGYLLRYVHTYIYTKAYSIHTRTGGHIKAKKKNSFF